MTTEEAKKKWCPMIRIVSGPNDQRWLTNRCDSEEGRSRTTCVADKCMWWSKCVGSNDGMCGMMRR